MARRPFYHPFKPYDIQQEFMQAVYDCIEDGKVGIFESPTGTGKSLSLLCGSLTWLREHKRKQFDESLQTISGDNDDDEPDWLMASLRRNKREEAIRLRDEFEKRLAKVQLEEQRMRKEAQSLNHRDKKARTVKVERDASSQDDDEFLLEDYDSDAEKHTPSRMNGYSSETAKMLENLGLLHNQADKRTQDDMQQDVKIFFCSRTHSQLSQTVGELRRIRLPASLPPLEAAKEVTTPERVKQISLGSRKNLCINPKVRNLDGQAAINERCLELQQSSSKQKCQFLPKQDSIQRSLDFRDYALSKVRDIEDLAEVGERLEICPYYASRAAIGPAEIITLPYPLLLQQAAREAMTIDLKGNIVIIDEAHNLMDAVEATYSSQITTSQLQRARGGLIPYLQRFRNRLKGSNRAYLSQLIRLMDSMLEATKALTGTSGEVGHGELLKGKSVDHVNLAKLARYISESKLARKVDSFSKSQQKKTALGSLQPTGQIDEAETPVLTVLQNFILAMINPSAEGRFFWSSGSNGITFRYLLLDPSHHFKDIVQQSRAVILAGGTMSPMSDHINQLFPYVTDVRTLSCGHIVPSSSLLVRVVGLDDTGPLDFTYKTRNDQSMIKRLGATILQAVKVVEGGSVVFFSSYAFLDAVRKQWSVDNTESLLVASKPCFYDSRATPAEQTFQAFADAVHANQSGAVLFSVIGGKLSEGINFSDNLGRCVIVVGMPYPNNGTPEWKAKIRYLEQKASNRANDSSVTKEFAENICMRAVNQAVGRAIRHKGDWASILLIDARYEQQRIQAKLPAWIRSGLPDRADKSNGRVSELCTELQEFFDRHR